MSCILITCESYSRNCKMFHIKETWMPIIQQFGLLREGSRAICIKHFDPSVVFKYKGDDFRFDKLLKTNGRRGSVQPFTSYHPVTLLPEPEVTGIMARHIAEIYKNESLYYKNKYEKEKSMHEALKSKYQTILDSHFEVKSKEWFANPENESIRKYIRNNYKPFGFLYDKPKKRPVLIKDIEGSSCTQEGKKIKLTIDPGNQNSRPEINHESRPHVIRREKVAEESELLSKLEPEKTIISPKLYKSCVTYSRRPESNGPKEDVKMIQENEPEKKIKKPESEEEIITPD